MKRLPVLLVALSLLLGQCQSNPCAIAQPEDQLPAATQTGRQTFGCLLNGQPWTPSGNEGPANYRLYYDPIYAGGTLQIRVRRYGPTWKDSQYFAFSIAPIPKAGRYPIDGKIGSVYYAIEMPDGTSIPSACAEFHYPAPSHTIRGHFTLTKLDLTQHILAGTFAFELAQPGCETVKVTKGRFDYNLEKVGEGGWAKKNGGGQEKRLVR